MFREAAGLSPRDVLITQSNISQPAFTYSKLTIETLEHKL